MSHTMRALALSAGVVAGLLCVVSPAPARPAHKRALADYFGPFLAPRLNDCRTCHFPDPPKKGDASEKPHNPFGARLREVRRQLRKAGKPSHLAAALEAIADEDSDGDGVPNLLELLAGHHPGEARDTPAPARVTESRNLLLAFRKSKSGYPWTPFERVRRPAPPRLKTTAWLRNPLDAFLAAEHERRGLKPRPEASRAVLLRRVFLDLIGLPPTPAQLHAFLADRSSDAFEKVVERLLASPLYGERWGRHWMDVWRYSDWAGWSGGKQIRDSKPHIWRWRDWIVDSLNEDKGYDRMVLEMLAADELAPEDPKALRATGYLVRNYKMLSREKWLRDTVEHTSMAFLGITLGCARCHDHMFDPLTQKEYYRVRAVFEPHHVRTDRVPGQLDVKQDGLVRVYDSQLTTPTYLFVRGDDRHPDKTRPLPPGVPLALGGKFFVAPVKLPRFAVAPDRRPFVVAELRRASAATVSKARAALAVARKKLAGGLREAVVLAEQDVAVAALRHKALLAVLRAERLEDAGLKGQERWKKAATEAADAQHRLAVLEATRKVTAARQAVRLASAKVKAAAEKKVVAAEMALANAEIALTLLPTTAYKRRAIKTYPATSTGRRLAFARWIAHRDNPLTARVAMNHIWMRHFGRALVPRVFDFGRNGQPPTHPALLDWLAVEFMERGWSMKAMHRLLLTSAAYRMASTPDAANAGRDRDNTYLWRMPSRRVEAEVVRDCVFFVAGTLELKRGGPDLDHKLGMTLPRRSLYFRHAAEKQMAFLKLFDAASVTECYRRSESIVPQQALALSNSDLVRRHARLLARKLASATKLDPVRFTVAAFEGVLSRPPTAAETATCVSFLKEQTRRYAGAGVKETAALRACESLVHVLLNHHDFVTIR